MTTGGCFCGKIRYEFDPGDYLVANCHCTSAAPFVTWVIVPSDKFRYTGAMPRVLESSDKGRRYFCADCGTPVACIITDRADHVDVTTGSLDDPDAFVPKAAVHEDTKLSWLGATEAG